MKLLAWLRNHNGDELPVLEFCQPCLKMKRGQRTTP